MIVVGVWTGVGFSNLENCRNRIQKFWNRSGVGVWKSDSGHQTCAWTGSGLDILQDTCNFFSISIGIGYSFLKKIGSGQEQDICLISITNFSWKWCKMSHTMVLLFSLLCFLYSQKIKVILSVCAALITIDNISCNFIVNIFRESGSSKLLLYCWYAALFCCAGWHMCVLCRLI